MRLGIDASNIRSGGGLTHLSQLLSSVDPRDYGFEALYVWGGHETLRSIRPGSNGIKICHETLLDKSLICRSYWQQNKLPRLAGLYCDLVFVPGTRHIRAFRPYVTLSQNMLPFQNKEMIRYGLSWMLMRILILRYTHAHAISRADGTIFLSNYAFDLISKKVTISKNTKIIPHGVDTVFYAQPRSQKSVMEFSTRKPFRLLYVSIVDVYKHQWNVVEAVWKLRSQGLPICLELIGPAYPKAMQRLTRSIEKYDPDMEYVKYYGQAKYHELKNWYHTADAFVYASSCENLPIILLESMASGLPIACSNSGPMPEVLGSAGVYFDPENVNSISKAIERLLIDKILRENLANQAYRKALNFSWEKCAHETFSFLSRYGQ